MYTKSLALRKGNVMHFPLVPSTGHWIKYLLFSGSLIGKNTLDRLRKATLQMFLKQNLKKQKKFQTHVLCVDKDQRRIQNQSALTTLKC